MNEPPAREGEERLCHIVGDLVEGVFEGAGMGSDTCQGELLGRPFTQCCFRASIRRGLAASALENGMRTVTAL